MSEAEEGRRAVGEEDVAYVVTAVETGGDEAVEILVAPVVDVDSAEDAAARQAVVVEAPPAAPAEEAAVETTPAAASDGGEALQGEIVGGTWINPNVRGYVPRQHTREITYTLPEGRQSIGRMIFGSFVILTDEIAERTRLRDEDDLTRQMIEASMRQAASQQQALEQRPAADLRYMTIGLASSVLEGGQDGVGRLSQMTDSVASAAGRIIAPVWNSFLFKPFHQPVQRAEQAGTAKVNEWIRRGRVEEVRSRALAEVSITNLVDESVNEIAANENLQEIVQEIIAGQSTGLVGEILEEIRERFVSLDLIAMGRLGRSLDPAPDFQPSFQDHMAERRPQYQRMDLRRSLAGAYAGPVTRFTSFIIDVVILVIVAGLLSTFINNALDLFGLKDMVYSFLTSGRDTALVALLVLGISNLLLVTGYFVVLWNLTGITIGDAIFGIRVVDMGGGSVRFHRSFFRLIGLYVSIVCLMLGFIWALFDRRRQGWHDKFGGTFVLYNWPARPEEHFLRASVQTELAEDGITINN